MPKLIALEENGSADFYVTIPTDQGGTIRMRKDLFLGELATMRRSEARAILQMVQPYNDQLLAGAVGDAVGIVKDVAGYIGQGIEALKNLINKKKEKNAQSNAGKVTIPNFNIGDPASFKSLMDAGQYTYRDGGVYVGPNHPLLASPIFKNMLGQYAGPATDGLIALVDPDYKAAAAQIAAQSVAPGPTGSQPLINLPKGDGSSAPVTKGFQFNVGYTDPKTPWYQTTGGMIGIAGATLALIGGAVAISRSRG